MAVARAYTQIDLTGSAGQRWDVEVANATTIRLTDVGGVVWTYRGSLLMTLSRKSTAASTLFLQLTLGNYY